MDAIKATPKYLHSRLSPFCSSKTCFLLNCTLHRTLSCTLHYVESTCKQSHRNYSIYLEQKLQVGQNLILNGPWICQLFGWKNDILSVEYEYIALFLQSLPWLYHMLYTVQQHDSGVSKVHQTQIESSSCLPSLVKGFII